MISKVFEIGLRLISDQHLKLTNYTYTMYFDDPLRGCAMNFYHDRWVRQKISLITTCDENHLCGAILRVAISLKQ